ncbi:MAG: GNAT family N-acetyltransferase [Candidatus Pacebacteria bacterium]|nr:GNAT family N-acetyltransferase [Candidatus Paceibacterota bacterium]
MISKNGSKHVVAEADNLVIRCASPNEIDRIVEIYLHVVQGEYISHGEVLDGITRDFHSQAPDLCKQKTEEFCSIISGQETEKSILVALEKSEVIGFLFGGIERNTREGAPLVASIYDLGVMESYRGHGIGRKLMEAFIRWAREKGAIWVFFESGVNNKNAHRLFHKLGFTLTSHVFMMPLDESLAMPDKLE